MKKNETTLLVSYVIITDSGKKIATHVSKFEDQQFEQICQTRDNFYATPPYQNILIYCKRTNIEINKEN